MSGIEEVLIVGWSKRPDAYELLMTVSQHNRIVEQHKRGAGQSREALRDARELIERGTFTEGYCMCGSPVDRHGIGDGHASVDAGDYYAGQVLDRIDAALNQQQADHSAKLEMVSQWQPIETAPTDGTIVDALNADTGLWEPVKFDKRDYWVSALYYGCYDEDGKPVGYDLNLSHWKPQQQAEGE